MTVCPYILLCHAAGARSITIRDLRKENKMEKLFECIKKDTELQEKFNLALKCCEPGCEYMCGSWFQSLIELFYKKTGIDLRK